MACDLLIVTSLNNLRSKHGAEGAKAFAGCIDRYIARLEERGRIVNLIDLPGAPTCGSWQQVKSMLFSASHCLTPNSCILILGDHEAVPFCELTVENDCVLSDSWYADFTEGIDHTPYCAVCRLPDSGDLDMLERLLIRSAAFQRDLSHSEHQFGLASEVWAEPSQIVYKQLDPSLQSLAFSPPIGVAKGKLASVKLEGKHISSTRILYFNLHGEWGRGTWFGERRRSYLGTWLTASDFVEAIDASTILSTRLDRAAVITSACYSTDIRQQDYCNNVVLALLRKGASVVIGPSSSAYGYLLKRGVPGGLSGIDLICYTLIQHLLAGRSAGDSLLMTKRLFAPMNPYDDVNILGLNLFGDPDFRINDQYNWDNHGR